MRIQIHKGAETQWVKEDRLQRFLDQGWHTDQLEPKKPQPKVRVEAKAEDVTEAAEPEEDFDWEAPLISMPTTSKGD